MNISNAALPVIFYHNGFAIIASCGMYIVTGLPEFPCYNLQQAKDLIDKVFTN